MEQDQGLDSIPKDTGALPIFIGMVDRCESSQKLAKFFFLLSGFMHHPEIHNRFLERIFFLKNQAQSFNEKVALESLEDEIEAIVFKAYSDEPETHGGINGLQ